MRSRGALLGFVLTAAAVIGAAAPAFAGPSDDDCLACHGDSGLKTDQGRPLFVDSAAFAASIHGEAGIACVDCHADLKAFEDFPHAAKLKPVDCASCHEEASAAVRREHPRPPSRRGRCRIIVQCKDCHGAHDIRPAKDTLSHTVADEHPRHLPRPAISSASRPSGGRDSPACTRRAIITGPCPRRA